MKEKREDEALLERAGVKYTRKGGLLLLELEAAAEFLRWCQTKGVKIIGLEAFRIEGGKVSPLMEWIMDYSMRHYRNDVPDSGEPTVQLAMIDVERIRKEERGAVVVELVIGSVDFE